MSLQTTPTDQALARLKIWLIIWPIIQQAPREQSHVRRCTSRRSQKTGQNPTRPYHHQALHAQTQMIWIEATDFSYASLANTRKRSRSLRQYPRSSLYCATIVLGEYSS